MSKSHIYKEVKYWFVDESGLIHKKSGLSIYKGILTKGFSARSAWLRYKVALIERDTK